MASRFQNLVSNWASGNTAPTYFPYPGGKSYLFVQGTLGGGSVKLQLMGPDATNPVDMTSAITSAGTTAIDLPAGSMRLVITGGSVSGLYVQLRPY